MPKAFLACIKKGGRVRTKELGKGKYMHICFIGKKEYAGEVKTKKKNKYTGALGNGNGNGSGNE